MYTIRFVASCQDEYAEIPPDALDVGIFIVEERLALALSELFRDIHVQRVEMEHIPASEEEEQLSRDLLPPVA